MTMLVRVLTKEEAATARVAERADFVEELANRGRTEMVSPALLDRWYGPRPIRSRATAILDDYGPPVSIMLNSRNPR